MKKYLAIVAALVCVLGAFALGRWMGLRQERDSFREKRTAICNMGMEYTLESFRSFLDTGDAGDYWEGARWLDRFLFAWQELSYGEKDDVVYTKICQSAKASIQPAGGLPGPDRGDPEGSGNPEQGFDRPQCLRHGGGNLRKD